MFNFSAITATQIATSNIIRQQQERRRREDEESNRKRLRDLENKKKEESNKSSDKFNESKSQQKNQQDIYSSMEKLAIDLIRDSDTFILLGIKDGIIRANHPVHTSEKYIEDTILAIAEQIKSSRLNNKQP